MLNNAFMEIANKYSFLENLLINLWKSCIRYNTKLKIRLQNIKWKNCKAKSGCAYNPTEIEQFANVVTHGIWIIPSILATIKLFERSKNPSQYLVSSVYGGSLILLFLVSTVFHGSHFCIYNNGVKNALHRCDRAIIYVFISASYFPWLELENVKHSPLACMEWIIWALALLGIAYQQIFHERFKCLETCFYILMGLGPALVVILSGFEFNGMPQLKLGGFIYIVGVCFFKSDGIIPLAHSIWHLFVALAAGIHYYAILENLYPTDVNSVDVKNVHKDL